MIAPPIPRAAGIREFRIIPVASPIVRLPSPREVPKDPSDQSLNFIAVSLNVVSVPAKQDPAFKN